MNRKKVFSLVSAVTIVTVLFTGNFVNVSATETTNQTSIDSTTDSDSTTTTDDSNTLKVNIDNKGALTYQEPVKEGSTATTASTGREDAPFSWHNATVYFALTDRFVNGDTTNDHSYGRGTDANGTAVADYQNKEGYFHGGDLKGITSKVTDGYFDNLGVNAIWITAPYEQIHGALSGTGFKHYAYHGYYTLDYTNVDANMGTTDDLANFIDTAHSHGIRVLFDIVMNHAGYANPYDANEYGYGSLASNWKSIYYGTPDSQLKWYLDYAGEAANNGASGMMQYDADWSTNWWGPNWVRMVGTRFKGYDGTEGAGITTCLNGLPDFKTEGTTDPGLPGILKKKWTMEGTFATKTASLDNYFSTSGQQRRVTTYLVKWLTDWVRNYGVDGFRIDTAKHVETKEWNVLKTEAVKALKQWRANNPTKPGAKWTDDFWTTGEVYDHGVSKDQYYTTGGFDSLINFSFPKNGNTSESSLESVYSSYASQFTADPSFNVLSYLSSHDKGLARNNIIGEGTALLLAPGAVQIYYGDETNRGYDPAVSNNGDEQSWRGNMNWSDIADPNSTDSKILNHWQILGEFRKNHLAVGAGTHKKLSASPYTFSRAYNSGSVSDKVVVSLPGKSGAVDVQVGDTFAEGESVIDNYTGATYTVSGGVVSVTAGDNGVVLLSSAKDAPKVATVSVTPGTKQYSDTLDITLNMYNALSATYSIDGGSPITYENGKKITIGAGLPVGSKTTVVVSTTDASGNPVTKSYTYTKIEPKHISATAVYFTKPADWGDNINAYVYTGSGAKEVKNGKWPGVAMTKEADGSYSYEVPDSLKGGVIIFNDGSKQYPGSQQPGVTVQQGKIFDISSASWSDIPGATTGSGTTTVPGTATTNPGTTTGGDTPATPTIPTTTPGTIKSLSISADTTSVSPGNKITFTATADTDNSSILYSFGYYKADSTGSFQSSRWTVIDAYNQNKTFGWAPTEPGTYKVYACAKYSGGTEAYSTPIIITVGSQGGTPATSTTGTTTTPGKTSDKNNILPIGIMLTFAGTIIVAELKRKRSFK